MILQAINNTLSKLGFHLEREQTNDGNYWDRYVGRWAKSEENKALPFVGSEWKGEDVFLSILREHANGEAIEIGCGGGRITSKAAQWFRHVHACDVSKEMMRMNRERVAAGNVSYHPLDGFTLKDFADGSMDCVFSHDVFVHFSSLQIYPYLLEIKRVLKPGGVGLISLYNFVRHFDLFKQMSVDFSRQHIYPPHMRVHFVTEEMVRVMLADVGLEVIGMDTENFLIPVFRK